MSKRGEYGEGFLGGNRDYLFLEGRGINVQRGMS
jgi:hypothetical protein